MNYWRINNGKYTVTEFIKSDMSYAGPLRVKMRLKTPKDAKEQEVYLGDIPLMTETGTFIINGAERVIVSQLLRSPGVVYDDEVHTTGRRIYSAKIMPYRGEWIEFEHPGHTAVTFVISTMI